MADRECLIDRLMALSFRGAREIRRTIHGSYAAWEPALNATAGRSASTREGAARLEAERAARDREYYLECWQKCTTARLLSSLAFYEGVEQRHAEARRYVQEHPTL